MLIIFNSISSWAQIDSTKFIPSIPDSTAYFIGADQIQAKKDTIYTIDKSFEKTATFTARDSIYSDFKKQKVYLYGDAKVDYMDIKLSADYIEIDMVAKEILATYTYDADSNKVGIPLVSMEGQDLEAGKLRMNYETKKSYINEVKIKQDENFLYMDVAKRHANEEIHFKKGRFTTCDLPEPHYHLQLSKAIMIPEKRIVSGPMNVWIKNVPTPIGFPFAIIPQKKENDRTHGILIPQIVPQSRFGMGLQNLGYFIPINDSIQTTIYASAYTRGSWDVRNHTVYKIRYKFSGDMDVKFQQYKNPFPSKERSNKFSIRWTHKQDQKANPLWNFSANVNFVSDNNAKNNIDPLNANYFNNTFKSDINLQRVFPGKPVMMGLKMSLDQNTQTKKMIFNAPVFSTNVTRFYPFKMFRKSQVGPTKWYEQIGVTYNLEAKNVATFADSLLRQGNMRQIGNTFQNGLNQNAAIQTTVSIFKNTWRITPSVTYKNTINSDQIRKSFNIDSNRVEIDTLNRFGMSQELKANVQLTSVFYSYYKFIGKKQPLLRHVLTPSFGYSYIPMLNNRFNYVDGQNRTIAYSQFEQSLYRETTTRDQSIFNFGFNNTFELKRKSAKDTITGFKKTRIIEAFSINGSYDFLRDSMKLRDIQTNLRIAPINFLSFVANATFSPYSWDDSTGRTIAKYALSDRQILGRFTYVNLSTTFTLTSKESKKKIEQNKDQFSQYWNSDFMFYALHPEMFLDFAIPWKVNFTHIYSIASNQNRTESNPNRYIPTHTISINGDISITKRWKVATTAYYDISSTTLTNLRVDLTRDMHCWRMSVNWIPIGFNKSFMVTIMGTSKLFSSVRYSLRRPPQLLF